MKIFNGVWTHLFKKKNKNPQPVNQAHLHAQSSVVSDSFATPGTVACQAPLSMGFSRQGYWSGLPFTSAEAIPDPGAEPVSPAFAGEFFTTEPPGKTF